MTTTQQPVAAPARAAGVRALAPGHLERAAIALFLLSRGLVALSAEAPVMAPDEPGAWAIAKWLAGTPGTLEMGSMPVYPLVSGAVLTPLWWLPVDGVVRYRLGLLVAAALVLAAALLVRRAVGLLGGEGWPAALATAVMLLVPSSSFGAAFTHAEPTVLVVWASLWWALCRQRHGIETRAAVVGSVAAGLAPFTHGRLVAAPLVWAAFLVLSARSPHARAAARRNGRGFVAAAGPLAVLALTSGAAWWLARSATAALWTDPEPALKGDPLAWALDPGAWAALVEQLLGQAWYVVAASAGLALGGVALLVGMLRRPTLPLDRLVAGAGGALVLANLAVSVVAMGGFLHEAARTDTVPLMPPRLDHLVYGRYVDALTLVLTCLGILWCWRRPPRRRLAAVPGAAAALLVLGGLAASGAAARHDELLWFFPTPNLAAGSGLLAARADPGLGSFTIWALIAVGVVWAAALRDRRWFAAVVCGWALTGWLGATADAVSLQRAPTPVDVAADLGPPAHGAVLAVAADTAALPGLFGNSLPGRYLVVSAGWRPETRPGDSPALARSPGDAEALLLVDGVDPGDGWRPVRSAYGATYWIRDAAGT